MSASSSGSRIVRGGGGLWGALEHGAWKSVVNEKQ